MIVRVSADLDRTGGATGGEVLLRSAHGPDSSWSRRAVAASAGRYGPRIVGSVVGPPATNATVRVTEHPRSA